VLDHRHKFIPKHNSHSTLQTYMQLNPKYQMNQG